MSEILARLVLRNNHLRKLSRQAKCTSKVAWNLARKYASSKPKTATFYSPVKASKTQKIECLLCIRELQCTICVFGSFNAQCWAKEIWAQIQWILWQGSKAHERLTATGAVQIKRVSTSFCSSSRSVRNSAITRWKATGSIASYTLLETRIFIWVENGETLQLTQNGKTITCAMDNSVPLVVSRLSSHSSSILSSTSRWKDQSNYSRKLGAFSDPVQTRNDKHACGKPMLTDPDRKATENLEPANELNKEDPTQGTPVW